MKSLVFTFRTYTHKEKLEELFGEVVILGKLKEDCTSEVDINVTVVDVCNLFGKYCKFYEWQRYV